MSLPNLNSVASRIPEIIAIRDWTLGFWGERCKPPILGKRCGVGGGTVRKSVGEFL